MADKKELTFTVYVLRDGHKQKLSELSEPERTHLAEAWNHTASQAAGCDA